VRSQRSTLRAVLRRVARQRRARAIRARLRRAPAPVPTAPPGPLGRYTSLLPDRRGRTVVVLAHRVLREEVRPWLMQFQGDYRHLITAEAAPEWQLEGAGVIYHVAETIHEMNWEIGLIGPVDVIINLLPQSLLPQDVAHHHDMWWRLYFHLKPDGLYLVDRRSAPGSELGNSLTAWMTTLASNDDPEAAPATSERDAELFRSTSSVVMSRDLFIARKRGKHYMKLRDSETSRVLTGREPRISVRELATLPAGDAVSRASVLSHEASVPIDHLPDTLPYPELHLRHYQGRIAFAGSTLMYGDYTILSDSFRHHLVSNFSNGRITNVSANFARIPAHLRPKDTLAGNYYQLDSTFGGHYGHFTTEVLSRFWGWDHAKELIPDLKVILRKNPKELEPSFERRFFEAYGIAPGDIVWTDRPVYLESVVSASPMWHNALPYYAHPGLIDVWERLARGLVDPMAPIHERIFVSRGSQWGRRTCRNRRDVEQFFQSNGFTVVYPEDLALSQQASIFAGARVIAGFGGSAMFNMMFAEKMTTAIVLSHEAYTARNEHLFTSLLGGDVHYFWSPPDIPHPENSWSQEAFYCDWEFDFERNRKPLEELITSP
jgi:capsular polysaccharide biosynthesis protein